MELLGQDLKEICSGLAEDGKRILVKTSARIVEQAVSATEAVVFDPLTLDMILLAFCVATRSLEGHCS